MVAPVVARAAAVAARRAFTARGSGTLGAAKKVSVDISLFGDKKLQRKFSRLTGAEQKKIVRQSLREGGKIVMQRARELVPKEEGALRQSIKMRSSKRSRKRIGVQIFAGAKTGKEVLKKGYVSFVELGTQHQPAQPFLRKARDERRRQFDHRVGLAIGGRLIKLGRS